MEEALEDVMSVSETRQGASLGGEFEEGVQGKDWENCDCFQTNPGPGASVGYA